MKTTKLMPYLILGSLLALQAGCGTWVGNNKDDDDDEEEQTPGGIAGPGQPGNGNSSNVAGPGDVFLQKLRLRAGVPFSTTASLVLGSNLTGNDVAASGPIEMTLVKADGSEVAYTRKGADNAKVEYTPEADGEFTVLMKNNTSVDSTVTGLATVGSDFADALQKAGDRADAPHKNVALKAVVAFARECKYYVNNGNSTATVTAAPGHYFAQPFVFLGTVGADKKVTPITTATIELVGGGKTLALKKLPDFDFKVYRESGLPQDEHLVYTRTFYQSYFGAAGEMYTVDTFLFNGDCVNAPQFNLGADPGVSDIKLTIKDTTVSPAIDASFPVRASLSTAFSMYTSEGQKLSEYTQCTIDRRSGEPKTYNGDAGECKVFSVSNPPYITLDYQLPSQGGGGVTKASDPTRTIYYGFGFAKAFYQELIKNSASLQSGALKEITIPGCISNGGLVAVPISADKTYLPLAELNGPKGDVINLARKNGSYTSLTGFYQGNVDFSGPLAYPTCIPGAGDCDMQKVVTVNRTSCTYKADSGISVTAIGNSMIYPSYFEMSGIIAD